MILHLAAAYSVLLMQFSRDYQLTISYDNVTVVVQPPFRITFDVYKSTDGGLNRANIQVYNLKEDTRLKLVKDVEENKDIDITLLIGYQGLLRQIYKGKVHKGVNARSDVDFITSMESLDGGRDLFYGFVAKTIKGKQQAVSGALEGLQTNLGATTQQSELARPKVMVGNAAQVIDSFLEDGQQWYIEDGQLFILNAADEVVRGSVPVVSAQNGLLETPAREMQKITFKTLTNPNIPLGGLVELISTTAPHLNGKHKVQTINTKGDYDGDEWSMTCECIAGTYEAIS